jgi:hypothetical protein
MFLFELCSELQAERDNCGTPVAKERQRGRLQLAS